MSIGQVEVTVHVDPNGFIVMKLNYPPRDMLRPNMSAVLDRKLTLQYLDTAKDIDNKSCLITIIAEVAGSPLVRALYDLYKTVNQEGGELFVCAGYPIDYLPSLKVLGLPSLPGFKLADSEEEGLEKLRAKYPV